MCCRLMPYFVANLFVKSLSYLHPALEVRKTKKMGRGVFTTEDIEAKTTIEIVPVLVMSPDERISIDKTMLHDYIFEWGDDRTQCCMALGLVPLYNHSYESNCEYAMNFQKELIAVMTVRDIQAGEELFINYNGDWNNSKQVWFHKKINPGK
jgi:SET domain-containing protein